MRHYVPPNTILIKSIKAWPVTFMPRKLNSMRPSITILQEIQRIEEYAYFPKEAVNQVQNEGNL